MIYCAVCLDMWWYSITMISSSFLYYEMFWNMMLSRMKLFTKSFGIEFCIEMRIFSLPDEVLWVLYTSRWVDSIVMVLMKFLFCVGKVEASTNQVAEQQMPAYNLPSKILCRVVHVHLKVWLYRSWIVEYIGYMKLVVCVDFSSD